MCNYKFILQLLPPNIVTQIDMCNNSGPKVLNNCVYLRQFQTVQQMLTDFCGTWFDITSHKAGIYLHISNSFHQINSITLRQ